MTEPRFQEPPEILKLHQQSVYALCPHETGEGWFSAGADRLVYYWRNANEVLALAKTTASVYALLHDDSFKQLWVAQSDGTVLLLDLAEKTTKKRWEMGADPVFHLAFHPNRRIVAALGHAGRLDYFDAQTGHWINSWPLPAKKTRQMCWDKHNRCWNICADEGQLWLFNPEIQGEIKKIKLADWPLFSCVALENGLRIVGGKDARLYWLNPKNQLLFPGLEAHNYAIYQLKVSPNGLWLASASRDKTAKWWNVQTGQLMGRLGRPAATSGHSHSVNALCWLGNTHLLTAGDDKSLRLWTINTPENYDHLDETL